MYTLFILTIGIFIGWNLPQPAWAKSLQNKATTALRSWLKK